MFVNATYLRQQKPKHLLHILTSFVFHKVFYKLDFYHLHGVYRWKEALWNQRPMESIPRARAWPQAHTPATSWAPRHAQEYSGMHTQMRGSGTTVIRFWKSRYKSWLLTLLGKPKDATHIYLVTVFWNPYICTLAAKVNCHF